MTSQSAFYMPQVKGGGDDLKRRAVIRIVPFHWIPAPPCQAPVARSGLILTSGVTRPFTELPCCFLVTGRGSCRSRMLVRGTPSKPRLVLLTCLAYPSTTLSKWPGPCSMLVWWQIGSMWRCVEAQGDFSCVREMLVGEVVSFW